MYFEIYRSGELTIRGRDILNDLSWDSELMSVPSLNITLPITPYYDYINGREEIKIFVNDKCFWGIITDVNIDKAEEVMDLSITHVVHEWTYRQISVNNAIKDKNIHFLFKSGADVVRSKKGYNIAASNFECLPSATNFKELAKVELWKDDGTILPLSGVTYKMYTRKDKEEARKQRKKAIAAREKAKKSGKKPKKLPKIIDIDFETEDYAYTEISHLPSLDDKDDTADVYFRFFVTDVPDLYAQVQCRVTYEPELDNGELDIKNASVFDQLDDLYSDMNFAYPGWRIDYQDESEDTLVDYVYSRQNKLDALTKTMELTPDLFWRVGFTNEKLIEIGKFGKKKNWIFSIKPTGGRNIGIIEEPEIDYDFRKVVNVATVYSEKSAGGMNSLTMREVYNDPSLQDEDFPVVILRANVNNERDYTKYITQFPALAPNNELEYAVLDVESIALEDGHLIEGTFAFNDITSFVEEKDDEGKAKEITDADRVEAAVTAYKAAIRKLKQARRSYKLSMKMEHLPVDIQVGDKVRFIYQNHMWMFEPCSDYYKYLLSYDDWFYVTKISYDITVNETETNEITLEKYIKIDRETKESV